MAARPFLTVLLHRLVPERILILVTSGLKRQESFFQDVQTWLQVSGSDRESTSRALFFPPWETLPHDAGLPHVDVISDRLETLVQLLKRRSSAATRGLVIVTQPVALMQKTFAEAELQQRTETILRGAQLNPVELVDRLETQGYEPEAQVTQKGEVTRRGGIVDFFPVTSPWPIRLEFFGDQLESLRHFDPFTQISREEIAQVVIPPAGELGILRKLMSDNLDSRTIASLVDHLPSATLLLLSDPDDLKRHAEAYAEQVPEDNPLFMAWDDFEECAAEKGVGRLLLDENAESLETLEIVLPETPKPKDATALVFQSLEVYRPIGDRVPDMQIAEVQRREFFLQLHRWLRREYSVHVFCNNDGERQRFEEIWNDYGLEFPETSAVQSFLQFHIGTLSSGFVCDELKWVVVTDAEIFGRYRTQRPRRLKSPHAQTSRSLLDIDFADLEEGDYVVHLQHGIGRYLGLQMLPTSRGQKGRESRGEDANHDRSSTQECLVIEYAPNQAEQEAPKLYVPVTEAHLVSKYVGTGKARPPLNTLGGGRWAKAKAHAARAVQDLASELLAIQAARESQQGHPFPADTSWQREFEASFLYEETPDQLRAIIESKNDMESTRPMDRLICGDVGYGKTEVALRAAFKSVMGGKQVAVLVPTTVLAQQHFNTFRERMSDYPVRIELLSRFRNRREQTKVVENLAAGAVDIIIGTHRLLQSDIAFKDLGLVVVDEEQRFGVMHKEKFKRLRQLVDVLTLSATPIPRTLYLALTGARDMSTIETPPADRLPVETIVAQFDERLIRDAIRREMNREGQVFFLHNRVSTIDATATRLQALVPEARIVVGHGQMDADELEVVMTRFVNGDADVLLSTTIIESGLDIPNANTIIIDRADRFGLSELYQLRGRVGRYKHQAYAYLLLPRHAGLLADARKRISAIKQYSSLGSGFKIAMRDLEIRGAGNLLGPQQSGHITAVGFDLYCQLLKQSVSTLKGEKAAQRVEVGLHLDFLAMNPAEENPALSVAGRQRKTSANIMVPRETVVYESGGGEDQPAPKTVARSAAYIPLSYVSEPQQRIELYRKLAGVTDKKAVEQLRRELRDRFGPVPSGVELLLQTAVLRVLAAGSGVTTLETRGEKLMLLRNNDYIMMDGKFPRLTKTKAAERLKEIRRLLLSL